MIDIFWGLIELVWHVVKVLLVVNLLMLLGVPPLLLLGLGVAVIVWASWDLWRIRNK